MKAQLYFNGTVKVGDSTNCEQTGSSAKLSKRKVHGVRGIKRTLRKKKNVTEKVCKKEDMCEGETIQGYITKLQEIVPFSRKDRRLSKLEVITNAIDYIRELRQTLGLSPCVMPTLPVNKDDLADSSNNTDSYTFLHNDSVETLQNQEERIEASESQTLWMISVKVDDGQIGSTSQISSSPSSSESCNN